MLKGIFVALVIAGVLFFSQIILNSQQFSFNSILSPVAESEEDKAPIYPTWSPSAPQVGGVFDSRLVTTAQAVLSYDLKNEKMVFSKNADMKLPMASLTKIMTAFLALEEETTKKYIVSKSAAATGENAMGLTEGEVLTLDELLYGLMLPSGNDAAEVIAEGSKYGRNGFVREMNNRAKQLGMHDTQFTNPSGLEGDGDQYTTTIDLLKLTKLAMENPTFRKVVGTYEIELPYSANHKYFYLYNDTNLLTSYPGVKGVKTGFTWEAGLCLVTYLEHNDHKIIAVLLNSQNRRQEMKDLLDYTLTELGETPPEHE
jgi:D-alanyl-D-alanine carboxypeptidase (penicillin-binding protein 5/6)